MKKIETVWCKLLYNGFEKRHLEFQQQKLATELKMSLSTINHALKDLKRMGAIIVSGKGGEIVNIEKILMYWANYRDLEKDIVWQGQVNVGVIEAEGLLPSGSILGGYSAVRSWYKEPPADYNQVLVYHSEVNKIKDRFKGMVGKQTMITDLKWVDELPKRKETTSLGHTFVDLWNLKSWMAVDFIKRIRREMDELLS